MQRKMFEKKVQDNIIKPYIEGQVQPGYGIILNYDKRRNVANVLMAQAGSDMPGEMYSNVPCPSNLGVQGVNPEKGRKCWVAFKNSDGQYPIITHFYNDFYDQYDYPKQNPAVAPLPRFMYSL